ncbi:MAG: dienelactone hydrolase family protein [Deltaproteobacteria bacterium]|nr:MAG: dienelactone hydrolase family protein [Deltaproteobacteria bacterium]
MRTATIPYSLDGHAFDAYVAWPDGDGPHPAVMVCHAYCGRSEFEERRARELAALGYIGVAIDLYGVGQRGNDAETCGALMHGLIRAPETLRSRLAAAHEQVLALDGVDAARTAAIGFCFGGLCAILCARMGLPMRGVVSFHGLLKIGSRLDARVRARILVLHGQDDPMAPPSDVGAFAEEMKRIDADWQLHAYPGVVHAFTNPRANDPQRGTVYDAEADRRSRLAMERFLADVFAAV